MGSDRPSHRRIDSLWVLGSCAALALLASAPVGAGTWIEDQTLVHDGIERVYRTYVPEVVPPGGHPVVFVLHGGGGSMRQVTASGTQAEWPEIADDHGVLVLVPNGINRETGDPTGDDQAWNDCRGDVLIPDTTADDVGFLAALLDRAIVDYPVDPERVYVTGASNGGMMSYRLAFELGDRIAAIAAFIANLPADSECSPPDRAIPVFIANGDAEDDYMPWTGGCVKAATPGCRRGTVLSAEDTRDFWIAHNGIDAAPAESFEFPDLAANDGATATRDDHAGGFEGTEVSFHRIRGGGHTTPTIDHPQSAVLRALLGLGNQCRDLEGSRQAWGFFERHRLNGAGVGERPGRAGLLRIEKSGDGLELHWAGDCGSGATYGVYRGDLASGFASAAPEPGACSIPSTTWTVPPGAGRADFFVVVPNDGTFEGSYGFDGAGAERAPAAAPCHVPDVPDSCASPP